MADSPFSDSWYRVAELKPRLRSHAKIHRHLYRGKVWYVLQDLSVDRSLRFSEGAYYVIGLMDGRRTNQEIWEAAAERFGDDAPAQDEIIQILSQLHSSDLLQADMPPDTLELQQRRGKQQKLKFKSGILNPISVTIPIADPERFLAWSLPFIKPFLGRVGGIVWLSVVSLAIVLASTHWTDLTRNILDRILVPENLILIFLVFPVLKLFHEFGHAYATKAFGGEVHEMGVMMIVFTPIPYVDATSANSFREKWKRVGVSAAGLVVELFLASLALFIWLGAEPGAVRSVAFNVMLIAGVSTVLFNANPLIRFDGYYILSDWLEIPNLRGRAGGPVPGLPLGAVRLRPEDGPAAERHIGRAGLVRSLCGRLLFLPLRHHVWNHHAHRR